MLKLRFPNKFCLFLTSPTGLSTLSEISEMSLSEMLGMFSILWLATSGSIIELAGEPLLAVFDQRSGILDSNFGIY